MAINIDRLEDVPSALESLNMQTGLGLDRPWHLVVVSQDPSQQTGRARKDRMQTSVNTP